MANKKVTAVQLALLKKYESAVNSGRTLTAREKSVYQSLLNQLK